MFDFVLFSTGELSAQCVGPHKTAFCELFDHRDGTYSLNIKPQEHGRHTINIKYGGMIKFPRIFFVKDWLCCKSLRVKDCIF